MESGPKTLLEAVQYFASEENCMNYLAGKRWPGGVVVCPICGRKGAGFLANQNRWQCSARHPKRQFSIKAGTIMEDSAVGLDKWLSAIWLVGNCRNDISSREIHRDLGVTEKTAWFMLSRVRLAMRDDLSRGMLNGEVQVDESRSGGKIGKEDKDRNPRVQKAANSHKGDKTIVPGILKRGQDGKKKRVRATVVQDRKKQTTRHEVSGIADNSHRTARSSPMPNTSIESVRRSS